MNNKCDMCGMGPVKYIATASNEDHFIRLYQCFNCMEWYEVKQHRYQPANCPGHQWEFQDWGFFDNGFTHEIYWNVICDRCGCRKKVRWDSRQVGLREAVTMDDPRLLKHLPVNEQTARFHLGEEYIKNFWGE